MMALTYQNGMICTPNGGGNGGGPFNDLADYREKFGDDAETLVPALFKLYVSGYGVMEVDVEYRPQAQLLSSATSDAEPIMKSQHGLNPDKRFNTVKTVALSTSQVVIGLEGFQPADPHHNMPESVYGVGFRILDLKTGEITSQRFGNFEGYYGGNYFNFTAPHGYCLSFLHGRKGYFLDGLGGYFVRYLPDTWSIASHHLMPPAFRGEVKRLLPLLVIGRGEGCLVHELDHVAVQAIVQALGDDECRRLCVAGDGLTAEQLLAEWRAKGGDVVTEQQQDDQ